MEWVKLSTNYDSDTSIAVADDAAEVMFTRGLAYCGRSKTRGFIPDAQLHHLTRHPSRARRIAMQLTKAAGDSSGPWERVEGGFQIRNWDHYQDQLDQIEERRRSDRERKRRQRSKAPEPPVPGLSRGPSRDSHAEVTGTEGEGEGEAAAAAADTGHLDGRLAVLRSKLQAHTPLRGLRFDTLRPDQAEQLAALVDVHGDDPLVAVAIATCRHPAPTHASAFLGTWAALPPPGQRLGVVRQVLCDTHATPLSPSGACSGCASDQKAAR